MISVFSWQNSISLCFALLGTLRPNLPVIPGIFSLTTFAFQFPMMKRSFFLSASSRSYTSSLNQSTSASSALVVGT